MAVRVYCPMSIPNVALIWKSNLHCLEIICWQVRVHRMPQTHASDRVSGLRHRLDQQKMERANRTFRDASVVFFCRRCRSVLLSLCCSSWYTRLHTLFLIFNPRGWQINHGSLHHLNNNTNSIAPPSPRSFQEKRLITNMVSWYVCYLTVHSRNKSSPVQWLIVVVIPETLFDHIVPETVPTPVRPVTAAARDQSKHVYL